MASSRVEGEGVTRRTSELRAGLGVAGLAALLMASAPALADTLGTLPASEVPATQNATPQGTAPQSMAPQSIVPPGFGATNPNSGAASFPGGVEPDAGAVPQTVKSVPGSAGSGITVSTLGGVDASAAGLLDEKNGGLGADMWRGATRSEVERYLAQMPVVTGSPVMNDLARRLLLTTAQPPEGTQGGASLLAIRLERLTLAGHADLAVELAKTVQADKSPAVALARARAALAAGAHDEACAALADIPTGTDPAHDATAAFSLKLSAFCQVLAGKKTEANLTLDLAREEGLDDPMFYSLVAEATDGLKLKADDPKQLDILDVALYRLAHRELPKNAGAIATVPVVQTLARDESLPPETRILAGERAAMLGLIEADELAKLYNLQPFTQVDFDGLKAATFPPEPAFRRALLYQAINAEVLPTDRAELIKLMLSTGESAGLYLSTVEVLLPVLTQLTPSSTLRTLAPSAVRAFLLVGDQAHAAQWYALVAPQGQGIGRDARELGALMRISDPQGPGGNGEQIAADLRADLRSGVSATRMFAAKEALLLQALGYPVPQDIISAAATAAPTDLMNQLQNASGKNAVGEVVLLSLVSIGPGGPDGAVPQVTAQAVSSLRAVNLGAEARRLATEALMGRSHAAPG